LPVPLTHAIGEGTRVFKMQEQRLAFERRSPCMHGRHAVPAMQVIYQKASIASCLSCLFIFSYPYLWVIVSQSTRAWSWGGGGCVDQACQKRWSKTQGSSQA